MYVNVSLLSASVLDKVAIKLFSFMFSLKFVEDKFILVGFELDSSKSFTLKVIVRSGELKPLLSVVFITTSYESLVS